MKRVAAQVDCGRLYGGTHEPRVVRAAGAQYVIKRTKPCEYGEPSKENGNETLANVLASQVGVRVADCAAVAVASDFTWGDDAAGYGPGEYFGSLYLPEFSPILAPERSRINEHHLYLIYAFDLWLCNPDRKAGDLLFWSYNNVDAARLAAERLGGRITTLILRSRRLRTSGGSMMARPFCDSSMPASRFLKSSCAETLKGLSEAPSIGATFDSRTVPRLRRFAPTLGMTK